MTGATGFVGANLARRFVRRGDDVHLLLRQSSQSWRLNGLDGYHRHNLDLTDRRAVEDVFARIRPDAVLHLATYGAYATQADRRSAVGTNVEATMNLMDCAGAAGVRRFINTGSSSEYGYKDHAPDESEAVAPNSLYAVTKVAATHYGKFVAATTALHVTTLRLYSVYGPFEEPTRLIPTLIVQAHKGLLPPLVSPSTARDFIFVDDVVDAYESVLEANVPSGEVYNVGTGVQTSMTDVVDVVRKRFAIDEAPRWGSMARKSWDTDIWIANVRRIEAQTGWRAKIGFAEGFARTAAWLTASAAQLSFYERSKALPQ